MFDTLVTASIGPTRELPRLLVLASHTSQSDGMWRFATAGGCCVLAAVITVIPCTARDKGYAPLRPRLLTAKKVALGGGPPDVLDKAYDYLTTWGRFSVVSDSAQADIVMEFVFATDPSGIEIESLTITDAVTGELQALDALEADVASLKGDCSSGFNSRR